MTLLFTVVIPLYNKCLHIENTINSVLSQSYSSFELIIVDDGSSDTSASIVQSFSDERVHLIRQENKGVSAARNRGAKLASGDFVAYLDADDYWSPNHLARLRRLIEKYPGRGLYSCAHAIVYNQKIRFRRQPSHGDLAFTSEDFLIEYASDFALVNSSTACLPIKLFDEIGGFPTGAPKGEDVFVWIRAALERGAAYDGNVSAFINRDAHNRSAGRNSGSIVHYIAWLDRSIFDGSIERLPVRVAARQFAKRALLLNAAGACLEGDQKAFRAYKDLRLAKDYKTRFILALISKVPTKLLSWLRDRRHDLRKPDGGQR